MVLFLDGGADREKAVGEPEQLRLYPTPGLRNDSHGMTARGRGELLWP
jgi:hypothetical protein